MAILVVLALTTALIVAVMLFYAQKEINEIKSHKYTFCYSIKEYERYGFFEWRVWVPDNGIASMGGEAATAEMAKIKVRRAIRHMHDELLFHPKDLEGEVFL